VETLPTSRQHHVLDNMGLVGFAHMGLMGVKQCHKSAMTGNGNHTTYKFIVMTGGWFILVLPTLDIMLIFLVVPLVHSNHQHASACIGHITQEEIERIWGARDTGNSGLLCS